MANDRLVNAVLEVIIKGARFETAKGEIVQGVTQTDLMTGLREKGWKLPAAGFFWNEITNAGFRALQPYKDGDLRQIFSDNSKGRKLAPYNTVYTV